MRDLTNCGVLLTREKLSKEAERCESEGMLVCEVIVKTAVAMSYAEDPRGCCWCIRQVLFRVGRCSTDSVRFIPFVLRGILLMAFT